ncbi:hypothetical protein [uncultured Pseudomonas sp.]|uniref:hypothetical protein n=1 Tax=uncultured Pseudomonas sp. TaxID=114707 RepID=UPI0025FABB0D|nr:hypothetical protein [uncultured Pseudomonas sp.]
MSANNDELRQLVTDALVGMISGVTGLVPPTGPGSIPDFVQAPIDRAVERIIACLPVGAPDGFREAQVVGFKPGMGQVTLYVGRLPAWLDMGHTCYVSAAPAAPTVKAEQGNDGDNIQHLTDCDESGCERCENLMHFYQACEACGAWGHNDSGPCTCSQSSAPSDTQRLDFMLANWRKVVCERLPHDNYEVYVEEGFMGDKRYPGVRYSGEWEQGTPEALEIQREAIDAAITFQSNELGGDA